MSFILPPIFELTLVGVASPGVPHHERIVLRPTDTINLAAYPLFIGAALDDEPLLIVPQTDAFFHFGDVEVTPPCWILLYTGHGQPNKSWSVEVNQYIHTFYWGRNQTLFHDPRIRPAICRITNILIGQQLREVGSTKKQLTR